LALSRFRRFDVQATYALALSVFSAIPCLAAAAVLILKYDSKLGQIVYGSGGKVVPAFLLCVVLSLLPGFAGFLFGLSSAGQRRNDKPNRSWIGFFVGGAVCTVDVILVLAFVLLRFEIPT